MEQIYLYDKRIGFCRACYACFKTGKCVPQDLMVKFFGGNEAWGVLKIVFGIKRFLLYLAFVMVFAFLTGVAVNLIIV